MSSLGYALYNERDESGISSGSGSGSIDLKRQARNKTIKKKPTAPPQHVQRMLNNIQGSADNNNKGDFYFEGPDYDNVDSGTNISGDISGDNSGGDMSEFEGMEGMADFNPPPKAELSKMGKGVVPTSSTHLAVNNTIPKGFTEGGVQQDGFGSGGANMPTPYNPTAGNTNATTSKGVPIWQENFSNTLPNTFGNDQFKDFVPYFNHLSPASVSGAGQSKDELLEKLNYMIHLLEEQQDDKTGHVLEEIVLYSFLGIFIIFIVDSFARAGKYIRWGFKKF